MIALAEVGLPELVAAAMMVALNAYVLMGGADFGGGVWDLLARGPRCDEQRALVASSIGPIWEANHVWLIIVVVVLFTGFPAAFATLGVVLHIPLSVMLIGIVLRGSAFVFRSYGAPERAAQLRWGRVFAISSVLTPVLLGIVIGAIASGAVSAAAGQVAEAAHGAAPSFASVYVAPWFAPFPIAVGALALALFAFLAAVYLTIAARDDALRNDFRRRALAAAVAVFLTALVALLAAHRGAPVIRHGLMETRWALLFQLLTAAAALTAIGALWTRRYQAARVAAGAQVSLVLWGWALAQYPALLPPDGTIRGLAAPPVTLRLLLWGLLAGSVVLLPSLAYLFRTFARTRDERSSMAEPAGDQDARPA